MYTIVTSDLFSVRHDDAVRSRAQERALGNVQRRARGVPQMLRKMERDGSGGVCRESTRSDVPLSARTHQLLSQAHATKRLYLITAQ